MNSAVLFPLFFFLFHDSILAVALEAILWYSVISPIGQGAFGVVVKATDNEICSLLDALCTRDTISLVLEYVEYNMKIMIEDSKRSRGEEKILAFYFKQLLQALAYLSKQGIMHRDIKPENILISATNVVKIADFGQACLYFPDRPDEEYEEQVGTRFYRAPELFFGLLKYSPAIDVWSAGCVLAEAVNGEPLFGGHMDIEQVSRIFHVLGTPTKKSWPGFSELPDAGKVNFQPQPPVQDWSSVVPRSSLSLQTVLSSMLCLNPERRLRPSNLLKLPFFRSATATIVYRVQPDSKSSSKRKLYTLDSILGDMSL